jgi:hypothetical protein
MHTVTSVVCCRYCVVYYLVRSCVEVVWGWQTLSPPGARRTSVLYQQEVMPTLPSLQCSLVDRVRHMLPLDIRVTVLQFLACLWFWRWWKLHSFHLWDGCLNLTLCILWFHVISKVIQYCVSCSCLCLGMLGLDTCSDSRNVVEDCVVLWWCCIIRWVVSDMLKALQSSEMSGNSHLAM